MIQSELIEVAYKAEAKLGEVPTWEPKKKILYWADMLGGRLYAYQPTTKQTEVYEFNEFISRVVPRAAGGLVITLRSGFAFFDPETKKLGKVIAPPNHPETNRFNDGICDPEGRFWASTMSIDKQEGAGVLYCLDVNHEVSIKVEGVTIPNGIVWSLSGDTMYFIDSPTSTVFAFDYEKASGAIQNKRKAIVFTEGMGKPDGMTIDSEGMLWIAQHGAGQVGRWAPETGKQLFSIKLPVSEVTCCTFGGEDLDDLYITTARESLSKEQIEKEPLAGSLFCYKNIGVKGVPQQEFKG